MVKLSLIKPSELYNILNQRLNNAFVSDPYYAVLFDSRVSDDYQKSHIITAKNLKRLSSNVFRIPYEAELDCKLHVIVYDGNTSSLKCEGEAVKAAEVLYDNGSYDGVKILEGGFELFTRMYPFMRSEKVMYLPRELESFSTYPLEVLFNVLYMGTPQHAGDCKLHRQMNIEAHLNYALDANEDPMYQSYKDSIFTIRKPDDDNDNLLLFFDDACDFIQEKRLRGQRVLIVSKCLINQSVVIAIAYLIKYESMSLKDAWMYLRKVCLPMQPSWCYMVQLAEFECKLRNTDKPILLTEDEYYER
ncbi:Serine/threonine/tyrosine-interacting-like protein 1 [Schistosoma japonicum]|nr:Serine/threonine/tyrosine-interacting-like protein 1 [Schistosoma japonicum]